jgi:hypothetical protein
MNQALRQELLALAEQDQSFLGSPEHDQDSDEVQRQRLELLGRLRRRLVEILDTYGWPGRSLVGEDGAEAAWALALHVQTLASWHVRPRLAIPVGPTRFDVPWTLLAIVSVGIPALAAAATSVLGRSPAPLVPQQDG